MTQGTVIAADMPPVMNTFEILTYHISNFQEVSTQSTRHNFFYAVSRVSFVYCAGAD
jgi:hypothetical protein